MGVPGKTQEGKRWLGAILAGVLIIFFPWILSYLGVTDGVRTASWVAIVALWMTTVMKIAYAPALSGDGFTYARQGNDFCLVTIAGSITNFSVQSSTMQDLFPAARRLIAIPFSGISPQIQNIIVIVIIGVLGLVGFLLTAYENRQIRERKDKEKQITQKLRAVGCYVIGVACAAPYVLTLAAK